MLEYLDPEGECTLLALPDFLLWRLPLIKDAMYPYEFGLLLLLGVSVCNSVFLGEVWV